MLIRVVKETTLDPSCQVGVIMSDFRILTVTTGGTLRDIAKQAAALATGLQNAAPGDKAGTPNNSVAYLFAVSESLAKSADLCEQLAATETNVPKPGQSI